MGAERGAEVACLKRARGAGHSEGQDETKGQDEMKRLLAAWQEGREKQEDYSFCKMNSHKI